MAQYEIPVIWQSARVYSVEADSLQGAIREALKTFLAEPDDDYLCDSFEIDPIVEEYGEEYDVEQAI